MIFMAIQALGGLGIFLLGMIIMSDGLRALAGTAMRRVLMIYTRSPLSGAITGAATTALLQSSSATTVAAVGFVAAGLMEFSHALGIIFGANLGTTITGWLVALLGFKLKLGLLVLPLIFVGVVMRLFSSGRMAHVGYAMAGFSLIFVGIAMMQEGMAGAENIITTEALPGNTVTGRALLVLIGIGITLITQSSSAGVAATLTMLYAGAIDFEQAAALVIGMDVGTTVTAAMATIGGSVGAKRTGFSHVIYNLFTAVGAFLLITPYVWIWEQLSPGLIHLESEIALVVFHTTFNVLGVIVVLPFTRQFATLMQRIVKDPYGNTLEPLDESLLNDPGLALAVVQKNIHQLTIAIFRYLRSIMDKAGQAEPNHLQYLQHELDKTHAYIDRIHLTDDAGGDWQRLVSMIHTLDHLQRLHERCEEDYYRATTVREAVELTDEYVLLQTGLLKVLNHVIKQEWPQAKRISMDSDMEITKRVEPLRTRLMHKVARGGMDVPRVNEQLEAVRWLERVSRHVTRICHHYNEMINAMT